MSVSVNGQDLGLQGRTAILDTGTTLIGGPSDSVTAIWNAVANSEQLSGEFEGFWAFREYLISCDLTLAPRGSSSSER